MEEMKLKMRPVVFILHLITLFTICQATEDLEYQADKVIDIDAFSEGERCGRSDLVHNHRYSDRIANGRDAKPGAFPSFARLVIVRGFSNTICGGILIAPNLILTAAHCVYKEFNHVVVSVGLTNADDMSMQTMVSTRSCYHPNFIYKAPGHDLALIVMPHNFNYTNHVQPACIPKEPFGDLNNYYAIGIGTVPEGGFSKRLKYLEMNKNCSVQRKPGSTFTCFSFSSSDPANPCPGDSGSGIYKVVNTKNHGKRLYAAGLLSFIYAQRPIGTYSCSAEKDDLAFYTDLGYIRKKVERFIHECLAEDPEKTSTTEEE